MLKLGCRPGVTVASEELDAFPAANEAILECELLVNVGWRCALELEVPGCKESDDDPKHVIIVIAEFLAENGAVFLQPGALEVVTGLVFIFAGLVTPPDIERAASLACNAIFCMPGNASTAAQVAANGVVATPNGHGWQHGIGEVGHEELSSADRAIGAQSSAFEWVVGLGQVWMEKQDGLIQRIGKLGLADLLAENAVEVSMA